MSMPRHCCKPSNVAKFPESVVTPILPKNHGNKMKPMPPQNHSPHKKKKRWKYNHCPGSGGQQQWITRRSVSIFGTFSIN